MNITVPSREDAQRALMEYEHGDSSYGHVDRAISSLVAQYRTNDKIEPVLLKATVINSLYSTNVYGIYAMAEHIVAVGVDQYLAEKSPDVVDHIADATIGGKKRCFYSFASKYCSFHDPETYPIYDSVVWWMLQQLRNAGAIRKFKNSELDHYSGFQRLMIEIRDKLEMSDLSLRQFDKAFWIIGKQQRESIQRVETTSKDSQIHP